jgi:hypothetical protein
MQLVSNARRHSGTVYGDRSYSKDERPGVRR